jgi:hypothetical protein
MRLHHTSRSRRGVVLVQFALLVVVLLGLAALSSDLGLARNAGGAMQNAVDSAALEGLRWSDQTTDAVRRERAAELVRFTFDGDGATATAGDYENVDDRIGAGPVLQVVNAGGVVGAGGLVPGSLGVHKPSPALNLVNQQHGDLVAGRVRSDAFGGPAAPFAVGVEDRFYGRNDFDAATGDAPAFLVRLRRTPDLDGLDAQSEVSTTGGGIPLIFGLGPLTLASQESGYDVRALGIAVRATAIADGRSVVAAGPFLPELAPTDGAWSRLAFGHPLFDVTIGGATVGREFTIALVTTDPSLPLAGLTGTFDVALDGALTETGAPAGFELELVMTPRTRALELGSALPRDASIRVGDVLEAVATDSIDGSTMSFDSPLDPADPTGASVRHALLIPVVKSATREIVGFVAADVYLGPSGEEASLRAELAADPGTVTDFFERPADSLRIALLPSRVLPINASSSDAQAWRKLEEFPQLLASFRSFSTPALAPTLVR